MFDLALSLVYAFFMVCVALHAVANHKSWK